MKHSPIIHPKNPLLNPILVHTLILARPVEPSPDHPGIFHRAQRYKRLRVCFLRVWHPDPLVRDTIPDDSPKLPRQETPVPLSLWQSARGPAAPRGPSAGGPGLVDIQLQGRTADDDNASIRSPGPVHLGGGAWVNRRGRTPTRGSGCQTLETQRI